MPREDSGFMWSLSPELDQINQELWKDPLNENHSDMIMRACKKNKIAIYNII